MPDGGRQLNVRSSLSALFPYVVSGVYLALIVSGFFIGRAEYALIRAILIVPLLGVFILTVIRFGRSSRTPQVEIEFGVLFVILTAVVVQMTGFVESPLSFLVFLAASVLALMVRVTAGSFLFLLLVAVDLLPRFTANTGTYPIHASVERGLALLFFFGFFLFYGRVESGRRREVTKRLERFEEDLRGVVSGVFGREESISQEGVGKGAVRALAGIDDLLFEVLDRTRTALSANTVAYLVTTGGTDSFRIREGVSGDDAFDFDAHIGLEVYRRVMVQKTPLILSHTSRSRVPEPGYYRKTPSGVGTLAIVPVVDRDEAVGLLVCDSKKVDGIGQTELLFIELVAVMVRHLQGLIVHLKRVSLSLAEFEELYGVSRDLAGAKRMRDVYAIVYAFCQRMLPVGTMVFTVALADESEIVSSVGEDAAHYERRRFLNADSLVGWVVKNGQYLAFPEKERKRYVFGKAIRTTQKGSLVILPLIHEGRVIGTFVLHTHSMTPPSPFHIRLVEVVLNMASVSITVIRSMVKLNRLAVTDPLTGLFNRRSFTKALRRSWEHADRYAEPLSLLMIDIDRFKAINDTHGHAAGDEVIKAVARMILSATRKVDIASRIGGEEFAVILPQGGKKSALFTAERIRKGVRKDSISFGKKTMTVTVSIGIAAFPDDVRTPDNLMKAADKALYAAKEGGRDRCVYVD